MEHPSSNTISPHCVNNTPSMVGSSSEAAKRKRGRPRKYGPDTSGTGSLALSPSSATQPSSNTSPSDKRGRGRPPGTGKKQQLASLGDWLSGSVGMGFTPHIITIVVGENIATKVLAFSQQGPRAICVLSANGVVSSVTLRQPSTSGETVTLPCNAPAKNAFRSEASTDPGEAAHIYRQRNCPLTSCSQ
ncbi:hypothetical protein ACFE04_007885 [Oxalis oulophora]